MKNLKKRLFSIVCGIFMAIFSVFSMTGCTLVSIDSNTVNQKEIMRVGSTTLTQSDIMNLFYTYYQSNGTYFSYYDDDVIEESFYTWASIKQILLEKAEQLLEDGTISYTAGDEADVWESVYEYIYSQVSSYEEVLYESAGYEEDDYPTWLQDEEDEEEETVFEAYSADKTDEEDADKDTTSAEKSTDDEIISEVSKIKAYVFEYVSETDENGEDIRSAISSVESKYIEGARNQAYANYISGLVSSAKSNGTSTDSDVVLNNEVIRVYEAYYESKLTELLQDYYIYDYLINSTDLLSDSAVVEEFLELYFTDYQTYQIEDAYVSTMTSSSGATLVFYHYNGSNYFFSVQHILVQFDDTQTDELSEMTGYNSSSSYDFDAEIYESYSSARETFVNNLISSGTLLTEVNFDNEFTSIEEELKTYGNYYYYDESDTSESNNYGYIKLSTTIVDEATIYYVDADNDSEYDEGETTYTADEVTFMATVSDILNCYSAAYTKWSGIVSQYHTAYVSETKDTSTMTTLRETYEDMDYIFDTVENMASFGYTLDDINYKLASYLFVELEWAYSSDSLSNDIDGKIGYIISNYEDENGSWVAEFANGARELIDSLEKKVDSTNSSLTEALASALADGTISLNNLTSQVISDYGVHII